MHRAPSKPRPVSRMEERGPGTPDPAQSPRGATGFLGGARVGSQATPPHDGRPEPWRLPPAVASEAGVQPQGALGAPTDGSVPRAGAARLPGLTEGQTPASARRGHRNTALAPGTAPCAPAPPDSPWPPQRRVSPRGLLQRRPALPSGASRRDPGTCTTLHGARRARPNRGAHTRARPRRRGAGKRRPTVNNTQRVSPLVCVKPTPGHEQPAAAPALVTRRLTTRTNPRFRP